YAEVVWRVRDLGVELTDRRAVKVLKLVAASAVLCGRAEARISDFWVLRYLWDREEQVAPLAALGAGVIEPAAAGPGTHPLAASPGRGGPEQLACHLEVLAGEIQSRKLGAAAAARAREQLTDLADRAAWLADGPARQHLVDRARDLLKYLG